MSSQHSESPYEKLTDLELEILQLITEKKSNSEISEILSLGPRKTEFLMQNIYLKLQLENKRQLLLYVADHAIGS
jgi:NarL family two-component system response regulator LiaR